MKKTLRNIAAAFAILGIISLVFWQIGWLISVKDICTLFVIAAAVIAFDLFTAWAWRKVRHH